MDSQEIRDKILAAINGIIKDEPETADANLHDVLAAKMRARINPGSNDEHSDVDDTSTEDTIDDVEVDVEEDINIDEPSGE